MIMNDIAKYVLDNMPFAMWVKDLDDKFIFANKAFIKLYGVEIGNFSEIENKICDKCSINSDCKKRIINVIKTKEVSKFEVTILGVDCQCYISPCYNDKGELIGTIGVIINITELKQKQNQIEERENILRTIIDTLPNYIFYKDKDCRYIGYNKMWKSYYSDKDPNYFLGKSDLDIDIIPKELAIKFIEQDKEVMNSKEIKKETRKFIDEYGNEVIEETIKVPVINEDGDVWGLVGFSSDITEETKLKEKLLKLSYTDTLTEVYNRAFFEEKSKDLNREKYLPMGIIMGDVNGLKLINDTFGHLKGDELLKCTSKVMKNVTSEKDFIFRWGGDEFIILMPNCNELQCEKVIKDILEESKNSKFDLIDMSISLGSSIKTSVDQDIYENIKEAEEKLYRQKFLQSKSIRSSVILSLNQSLHEKNVETEYHTNRLVEYARKIGIKLGFTTAQLDELELVTKLHDIGKIAISEEILLKPGKLTDEEFEIIKTHTEKGYRILQSSGELEHIAKSVLAHHERYDGKGYPLGLKEDEIPLSSRIVNVVDSYDAMISDRGYNKVKNKEEAINEIISCSGKQFDPNIASIFIEVLKEESSKLKF